jgi:hypothetical protein
LLKSCLTRKNINDPGVSWGNLFHGSENLQPYAIQNGLCFMGYTFYRCWWKAHRNKMPYLVLCIHVGASGSMSIHPFGLSSQGFSF